MNTFFTLFCTLPLLFAVETATYQIKTRLFCRLSLIQPGYRNADIKVVAGITPSVSVKGESPAFSRSGAALHPLVT